LRFRFIVDSTEEGVELRKQLTLLMKGAGFEIKKWCSNDQGVLQVLPEEKIEEKVRIFPVRIVVVVDHCKVGFRAARKLSNSASSPKH
jgi:hypothetical protein